MPDLDDAETETKFEQEILPDVQDVETEMKLEQTEMKLEQDSMPDTVPDEVRAGDSNGHRVLY